MKKFISILLLLALLLTGCAAQEPATETTATETTVPETTERTETTVPETTEETVPETTEETIPEPQVTEVESLLEKLPAILAFFSRGDQVEVVGEYDEAYLVVKLEEGWGLVEKSLLRMEGIEAPKTWTGYARYGSSVYGDLYLSGEPLRKPAVNTKLEVLEDLGWCYLVQLEEGTGFISKDQLSSYPITGGSGNGTGADGGDISMGVPGGVDRLSTFVPQEGEVSGKATVLADGTRALLGWFNRGDRIPLAEDGFAEPVDGYRAIYVNSLFAYVPEIGFPEAMEPWTGFARWGAKLCGDLYLLDTDPDALNTNAQLTVLQELEACYLVEFDGKLGYVRKDMVSTTRSSGGSGNSGGEWSPPVL